MKVRLHKKSTRIRSYSGSFTVQMWENAGQDNSEYGHILRVLNITFVHWTCLEFQEK